MTHSTTGTPLFSKMLATSASVAVTPVRISVTKMMALAESMAIWACSRIWVKITSLEAGSMPPVSTRENLRPHHSASPKIRSRVTPGVSSTMERRFPTILLKSVDFPTLGRPTMATIGFAIVSPTLSKKRGTPPVFLFLSHISEGLPPATSPVLPRTFVGVKPRGLRLRQAANGAHQGLSRAAHSPAGHAQGGGKLL